MFHACLRLSSSSALLITALLASCGPLWAQTAGLVAAYSFSEGTGGTLNDLSGSGNHGVISGAAWTVAGRYGSALAFDGVNDMVTINDSASLDLTTGMTIMAWVRPNTSNSSWRTVLLKEIPGELAYGIYSSSNNSRPGVRVRSGNTTYLARSDTPLPANTWTHLAATYDGATLRMYVNGVQIGPGRSPLRSTPARIHFALEGIPSGASGSMA